MKPNKNGFQNGSSFIRVSKRVELYPGFKTGRALSGFQNGSSFGFQNGSSFIRIPLPFERGVAVLGIFQVLQSSSCLLLLSHRRMSSQEPLLPTSNSSSSSSLPNYAYITSVITAYWVVSITMASSFLSSPCSLKLSNIATWMNN